MNLDGTWKLAFFFSLVALAIISIGVASLYSAAHGSWTPWAGRQLVHLAIGLVVATTVALVPLQLWFRLSYVMFGLCALSLLIVLLAGVEGGLGAQRWVSIGGFRLQPSEFAKYGLVLALANYFHWLHFSQMNQWTSLFPPMVMIGAMAALIIVQPNLGTSAITLLIGAMMIMLSGISGKKILLGVSLVLAALPLLWSVMHDYQKQRVLTFLDPERDPLGAGYNIIQSKIAIGSGGFWGKGFMQGSQSQLNFVPEKHTDFIFAIIAEELGFVGGFGLMLLFGLLFWLGLKIATQSQSQFGRFLAAGVMIVLFCHVMINMGMVMGLLPVVGVPLSLVSYGGSSLVSSLFGLGLVLNVFVHRRDRIYTVEGLE